MRDLTKFIRMLVVLSFAVTASAEVTLPGLPCTKAPVPTSPFPDALSAYVWRNWGLVPTARLAEVVHATPQQLEAVAAEMGLKPAAEVLPEWKDRGYITVLRRNWHLLPYDQLMAVLDKTSDELYFSLMEDDFLWCKLGKIKPKCERLEWKSGEVEKGKGARKRIAAILKEEGLDPNAPEEPRFAFVKDLTTVQPQPSTSTSPDSPFDFRLIFSYFADYGDPLGDPEIRSFPEGLLQKLSAEGANAVWLHTVLRTLATDPKYPELGEGSDARIANLKKLVARAGKYGIRVFLYMNEPRSMPPVFFEKDDARRAMRGAEMDERCAMCTSTSETLRWLSDALEQVFSRVPGLGGIFTISMSENLTHCKSKKDAGSCPRCAGRRIGDLIAETNRAMIEGMVRGNPKAEALVWNWAWPAEETAYVVSKLPNHNVRLMAVSENGIEVCRGGITTQEADYAISIVGPGESARRMWSYAKERQMPCVAKVQAANSWEISSFPYLPVMDLVAQHAVNLSAEGVTGVMLSWSLGCCPCVNLSVYRDLKKGEKTIDGVLDRLATRLYGADKVPQARKAWKAFSDGFANYPFTCGTVYYGPQQWGPANPLYTRKTGWGATMVGFPYDDTARWCSAYPPPVYAELMDRIAKGFEDGCRLLEGVETKRELDMFRAEAMHFASCRDQVRFVLARDAGDREGVKRYARAELERAKAYWPLVRADSRIGYESSNHYFYVPRDLLEKVLSCRAALD